MKNLFWLPVAAVALFAGSATAQRSLVPGEITTGSLTSADPQMDDGAYYDEYAFDARRGETVVLQMESSDFDAYLHLGLSRRSGGWRELARDDDGGNGRNARLQYVVPEDGTYTVRASSLSQASGRYTLTLAGGRVSSGGGYYDEPVRPARPLPRRDRRDDVVLAGERIDGYLSPTDPRLDGGEPFHLYRYNGRRGERLTLTLRSADFDSYLVIGMPGGRHGVGTVVARDDDGGGGRDSRIVTVLPEDRVYVIRVNPLAAGDGEYMLDVESDLQEYAAPPVRDAYDEYEDDDQYRDGVVDRRLVGPWELAAPGAPAGYDPVMGVLDIDPSGAYTWRKDGRLLRGQLLEFTPRRGAEPRHRYFVINDGREEFYVFLTGDRGERYLQVNTRATDRPVAHGYRDRR